MPTNPLTTRPRHHIYLYDCIYEADFLEDEDWIWLDHIYNTQQEFAGFKWHGPDIGDLAEQYERQANEMRGRGYLLEETLAHIEALEDDRLLELELEPELEQPSPPPTPDPPNQKYYISLYDCLYNPKALNNDWLLSIYNNQLSFIGFQWNGPDIDGLATQCEHQANEMRGRGCTLEEVMLATEKLIEQHYKSQKLHQDAQQEMHALSSKIKAVLFAIIGGITAIFLTKEIPFIFYFILMFLFLFFCGDLLTVASYSLADHWYYSSMLEEEIAHHSSMYALYEFFIAYPKFGAFLSGYTFISAGILI